MAYEWTPYRWRRLRRLHGIWRGVLPAPALHGIYQLQLRVDGGRRILSSARWLLRVFPHGVLTRRSSSTAIAAVRHFVADLPGDETLVALRNWRLGSFVTAVRDGFHGRWRILDATVEPYGP